MINSQDIKNGTCIRMDGKLYFVVEFLHVKPGKGNTFMRTKLKNVVNGLVVEKRFNIGEKLEDVRVERRPYVYSYKDGDDFIFMNQETFDQIPIAKELVNGIEYMKALVMLIRIWLGKRALRLIWVLILFYGIVYVVQWSILTVVLKTCFIRTRHLNRLLSIPLFWLTLEQRKIPV